MTPRSEDILFNDWILLKITLAISYIQVVQFITLDSFNFFPNYLANKYFNKQRQYIISYLRTDFP